MYYFSYVHNEIVVVLLLLLCHSCITTSSNNNTEYFSPPIVDYKCEKQYYSQRGIITLPKIQISNEELEYYESEVELFVACYKKYAPQWPKEKIGLFPLALSYSLLSIADDVEIIVNDVLTLLSNVYGSGLWGNLNVYDIIPQRELHKTLPDALDFFIPLIEYYMKNSMKEKMEIAEFYAGA
jgi:hypothetical protein